VHQAVTVVAVAVAAVAVMTVATLTVAVTVAIVRGGWGAGRGSVVGAVAVRGEVLVWCCCG